MAFSLSISQGTQMRSSLIVSAAIAAMLVAAPAFAQKVSCPGPFTERTAFMASPYVSYKYNSIAATLNRPMSSNWVSVAVGSYQGTIPANSLQQPGSVDAKAGAVEVGGYQGTKLVFYSRATRNNAAGTRPWRLGTATSDLMRLQMLMGVGAEQTSTAVQPIQVMLPRTYLTTKIWISAPVDTLLPSYIGGKYSEQRIKPVCGGMTYS
jgi:hypothetical protein